MRSLRRINWSTLTLKELLESAGPRMRNLLEWMEENADSPSSWFRKDMAVALGLSIDRISDLLEKLYERFGVDGMDALRAAILNKVRDQRPWVPADERTHEGT